MNESRPDQLTYLGIPLTRPRVAFFELSSCEGCQLQIVNLEEEILDLISVIDPVEWREGISDHSEQYDIAMARAVAEMPALIDRVWPSGLLAHVQLNDRNRRAPGQGNDRFGPVLAAIPFLNLHLAYRVLFATGMRIGEVCGLKKRDTTRLTYCARPRRGESSSGSSSLRAPPVQYA